MVILELTKREEWWTSSTARPLAPAKKRPKNCKSSSRVMPTLLLLPTLEITTTRIFWVIEAQSSSFSRPMEMEILHKMVKISWLGFKKSTQKNIFRSWNIQSWPLETLTLRSTSGLVSGLKRFSSKEELKTWWSLQNVMLALQRQTVKRGFRPGQRLCYRSWMQLILWNQGLSWIHPTHLTLLFNLVQILTGNQK